MPEKPNCKICSLAPYKYKCPNCLIKYCSIDCFKNHKEANTCIRAIPIVEKVSKCELTAFETVDTIPVEKLEKLRFNETLKDQLRNKHLRKALIDVNASADPNKEIEQLMKSKVFEEFAIECLNTIEKHES